MRWLSWLVCASCMISVTSYHVLVVNSMGTRSHLIQMAALVEELLERGNQVTSILFGGLNIQGENYEEIVLPYDFKALFQDNRVKKLLDSKPVVDVVITVLHSGAFFAEYFDCPIIQFSPAGPVHFQMVGTGNIMNPSIQPLITSPFIEPLTFYQRLTNHFSLATFDFSMDYSADGIHEAQKAIDKEIDRPKDILRKRTALVIA